MSAIITDITFLGVDDETGDYRVTVALDDGTATENKVPEFAVSNRSMFERAVGGRFGVYDDLAEDPFYIFLLILKETGNAPASGIRTAAAVLARELPPIVFNVEELLSEGLALLVGKPKIGKSWLALQIAIAVAGGTKVLDRKTRKGKVLYLALEDGDRRLQSRIAVLGGLSQGAERNLNFATSWQPLEEGGLAFLKSWIDKEHPVLVVIDVLQKLRSPGGNRNENAYERDYRFLTQLQRLTRDHPGLSVLVVHHEKKGAEEDFVEAASGSFGLTGAADATISVKRARGKEFGELRSTGRDTMELEWSVRFEDGRWEFDSILDEEDARDALGEAVDFIIAELHDGPVDAAKVKKHATQLGIAPRTLRRAKKRLGIGSVFRDGQWFWTTESPTTS